MSIPADPSKVDSQLPYAMKAVVIHQAEDWPTGPFCRNDHARWPCSLYHWGFSVLTTAGWGEQRIAELVRRVAAGELPWAYEPQPE
jgi:hypothetical protein